VTVFARGLLNHLSTRLYFADDPRTADDPVLQRVPPARRPTLLARRDDAGGSVVYRWDVVLQGDPETETVFFAFR
jgi:protocatechuate 3,4-dioxygenase alpha subunit